MFSVAPRPKKDSSFSKAYALIKELEDQVSDSPASRGEQDKTLSELRLIVGGIESSFLELERSISALAVMRLTEKQRTILKWLCYKRTQDTVYTRMVEAISEEFRMPESTARWNLKVLREVALLEAGDRNNKGIPVRLTEAGRIALEEELSARSLSYEE